MAIDIVWKDTLGVIAQGGGPVLITVEPIHGPDQVPNSDTDAQKDGFISLGLLTTDLTTTPRSAIYAAVPNESTESVGH